jgi:hypothetical protein
MKRKRIPIGKNTLSFSPRLQWIFRVAKAGRGLIYRPNKEG